MKRTSERGVALVITLIMLALVTAMSVVFLAVSRREKASVSVVSDANNARLMADAAMARAQSELAARMFTSTNMFSYDLIVSTNYYNPAGFDPNNNTNAYNVNYDRTTSGQLVSSRPDLWIKNIANLQFDPRPPVVYLTNQTGLSTNEFRFWLDLNRNRFFEPTGVLSNRQFDAWDRFSQLDGPAYYVGDPQWIGVLEHPDRPHSESNRFVGRYAFVVVPAGKGLDVNYMYNAAKRINNVMSANSYYRDQGVGSWELNLAGFLAGLNTNAWPNTVLGYNYLTNQTFPSTGVAFEDADAILRYRYQTNLLTLLSARAFYGAPGFPLTFDPFPANVDYYSAGLNGGVYNRLQTVPWSGSYSTNGYYDVQELFDPLKTSSNFVYRLTSRTAPNLPFSPPPTRYDRYTFYRMLGQLSTDSGAPTSNKLYFADHLLHYTNRLHLLYQDPNDLSSGWDTNYQGLLNVLPIPAAHRTAFFHAAADRMIKANLDAIPWTNGILRSTNFAFGGNWVRDAFSATNIQIFHRDAGRAGLNTVMTYVTNNEYTASTHRMLQLAANIHDSMHVQHLPQATNDYPSVFRPMFVNTATNLSICGYIEENNTGFLNLPTFTVEEAHSRLGYNFAISNINIAGVPLVIGAKKGFPNFNKLVVQTVADISRRLEIRKAALGGPPVLTNQMYVIGLSNHFGIEGWNSYTQDFNHNLELRVAGLTTFGIAHHEEGVNTPFLPWTNIYRYGQTITTNRWPGGFTNVASFIVPLDTNIMTLSNSVYLTKVGKFVPVTTLTNFEQSSRVPQWFMRMTNRLQYVLIDKTVQPNRVIDYVSLDKLVTDIDLMRGLTGDTNAAGGGIFSDKKPAAGGKVAALTPGDMWNPNHVTPKNFDSPTVGAVNQIGVSLGQPFLGEAVWRNAAGGVTDKDTAIQQFKAFMNGQLTNLTWQVPYTPSRRLYLRSSWEANDPLVHYTAEDLTEPVVPGSTNLLVQPIEYNYPIQKMALLRQLNNRYRPWGGNPNKDPSNDQTAYAITMKDSLIRRSDDWQFPTNRFPNIGWLGRVHRGTPWQTMYLKSAVDPRTGQVLDLKTWSQWSGSFGTHPTNDWKLLDLFTVAPNDTAARGLLSVNQTNLASWSAVLSGVSVLTNASSDAAVGPTRLPLAREMIVQPNSPQMLKMVGGVMLAQARQTNRVFRTLGDVLSAPELTTTSPYLNWQSLKQYQFGIDDTMYERVPQQILSLLKTDEPRVVVYAFGQSLRPADRSLVTLSTVSPPIFNLCTNYQVTGEFAAKTVLRLEDLPPEPVANSTLGPVAQRMRAVVESYTVLQPDQ